MSNLETVCRRCHKNIHGHGVGGAGSTATKTTHRDGLWAFLVWICIYFIGGAIFFQVLELWFLISVVIGLGYYFNLKSNPQARFVRSVLNTVKISCVLGLLWAIFILLPGITSLIGTIYAIYMSILVLVITSTLGYSSVFEKIPDVQNPKWSILNYLILLPLSLIVGWYLLEPIVDIPLIVDAAERAYTDEPTPIGWLIIDHFQSLGMALFLSLTTSAILLYRLLMDSFSVTTRERWSVILLQLLTGTFCGWQFLHLFLISRTPLQIGLAGLFCLVILVSIVWSVVSSYYRHPVLLRLKDTPQTNS